jgi:hypothetical protein
MTQEFVPYQLALELNQLGFDETCLSYYEGESFSYHLASIKGDDYIIPAPLFQQAFRWFRDKKLSDMCVCRYQGRDDGGVYYYYCITNDFGVEETRHFQEGFFSYEEAELACLTKLIEIVKTKTE